MISIPSRLLQEDFVTVLLQSPQAVLLRKELSKSTGGRQSYVSRHAITAVIQGEQSIQSDKGEKIKVQAGEMAVMRRGLYTVTDLVLKDGRFEACLIFFEEELLSSFESKNDATSMPFEATGDPWRNFATPIPIRFFWQSLPEWRRAVPNPDDALQNIKIQEYFALLAASGLAPSVMQLIKPQQNRPSRNIRQFMEEHYDKPLSIADYAYLTGRSESTFRREFKAKFGTTPRQWIIRRRLKKANGLLQATQKDVTQIAFDVGYDNVSHFINEYKKQYGRTPKQRSTLAAVSIR